MKKNYLFFLIPIVFFITHILSCETKCPINGSGNKNNGIIISNAAFIDTCCSMKGINKKYVIKSKSGYDSLISVNLLEGSDTCVNSIDFEQYTLLGFYASGQCNVVFERNVERCETEQKYVYIINVVECGDCYLMLANSNWILVPKIPEGWGVEFKLHKESY